MTSHELAHGIVDGKPIHAGDQVMVRAEVLQSQAGVGALLRLYSRTDEMQVWVREDHLRYALVDPELPPEPPDGSWLHADGSMFPDGNSRIFHRSDAEGHNDRDVRRFDRHWWDVVEQKWIDWPAAVERGAARTGVRRMVLLAEDQTDVDVTALDGALHSVWLHANWEWVTKKMDEDEREAAADAVQRHHERIDPDEPATSSVRWWRE